MSRCLVALMVALAVTRVAGEDGQAALMSLVESERAFARMSVATSQREAFLATFADDGVVFEPQPVVAKDTLRREVPPPNAPKRTLDWEPVTGDVAASGDLGYTTGPYTFSEGDKLLGQGWFFSVWKRQENGPWRVAADFGVRTTALVGALRPAAFRPAEVRGVSPAQPDGDTAREQLLALERAFAGQSAGSGIADAYRARVTADVRLYRPGQTPAVGGAALDLLARAGRVSWQPAFAAVSRAGDLAYSYGRYESSIAGGETTTGSYLHVWKRQAEGWKLAVEVINMSK